MTPNFFTVMYLTFSMRDPNVTPPSVPPSLHRPAPRRGAALPGAQGPGEEEEAGPPEPARLPARRRPAPAGRRGRDPAPDQRRAQGQPDLWRRGQPLRREDGPGGAAVQGTHTTASHTTASHTPIHP